MRLLQKDAAGTSWHLAAVERDLMVSLLGLPPGPRSTPRLSRAAPALNEAGGAELAEELERHRASTRSRIVDLLAEASITDRVEEDGPVYLLRFSPAELETFLQVLNEVRLAAWERLGRPDPPDPPDDLSREVPEFRSWFELVVAGRVQGLVLSAVFPA